MRNREKIGAILWILCAQFFVAEQLASRAWLVPYSFRHNFISDLGTSTATRHQLMNASFLLQGVLIAAGAFCLWTKFHKLGRLSLAFLMLCAAGVFLVGLAPSDRYAEAHTIGAATHFLAAGCGIFMMGAARLRGRNVQAMGWLSVFTGMLVLTATVSLTLRPEQAGSVERVGAYSIVLWLMASGFRNYMRVAGTQPSHH